MGIFSIGNQRRIQRNQQRIPEKQAQVRKQHQAVEGDNIGQKIKDTRSEKGRRKNRGMDQN